MFSLINTYFTDIEFVYHATIRMLSLGLIITSLEDIKELSVFQSTGLLSWKVSRLGEGWSSKSYYSKIINFILNTMFAFNTYLRLMLSIVLLILSFINIISPVLLFVNFFLFALITLRSPYGLDGAYQMYLVLLLALSLGSLFGIYSSTSIFCLWFITSQLVISYFISGATKLFSSIWRKAYAINMIFSTRIYGSALIYNLVHMNHLFAIIISWSVIIFETIYFTIFFVSQEYAVFFVVIGFIFHLFVAIFMGLNNFLFAFTATYPALLYCVLRINSIK